MKKVLSILLSLLMVLPLAALLPVTASADNVVLSAVSLTFNAEDAKYLNAANDFSDVSRLFVSTMALETKGCTLLKTSTALQIEGGGVDFAPISTDKNYYLCFGLWLEPEYEWCSYVSNLTRGVITNLPSDAAFKVSVNGVLRDDLALLYRDDGVLLVQVPLGKGLPADENAVIQEEPADEGNFFTRMLTSIKEFFQRIFHLIASLFTF
ncbi:MAG: hypothetical protein IJK64_09775 [Clostridia bacterium]|nr:hypothetical protein [Clostridia bacterium]